MLYTAIILMFIMPGTGKYVSEGVPGAETRIYISLGPQGPTEAECSKNADAYRRVAAKDLGLNSYMQLKYRCIQIK